ncbi:MAG: cupredoxin domain-containing protein [Actinobacteria bacterium]|nr:cupredoxin domain-containing protein [Actinomycetota bacterium]
MGWRKMLAAGAVIVAMVATGCGGDDGGNGGDTGDGGGSGVTVTAADFSFDPTELSVSSGDTVTVTNDGAASHTFTIEEHEDAVDEEVAPGDTADVTIDVPAGEYEFYCEFHPDQMTGTLTVS